MPESSHLISIGLIENDLHDNNLNKDNNPDDKSENCCLYLSNYLNNCVLCCFICLN
jgi:hypothetical protein